MVLFTLWKNLEFCLVCFQNQNLKPNQTIQGFLKKFCKPYVESLQKWQLQGPGLSSSEVSTSSTSLKNRFLSNRVSWVKTKISENWEKTGFSKKFSIRGKKQPNYTHFNLCASLICPRGHAGETTFTLATSWAQQESCFPFHQVSLISDLWNHGNHN